MSKSLELQIEALTRLHKQADSISYSTHLKNIRIRPINNKHTGYCATGQVVTYLQADAVMEEPKDQI